MKYCSKCDKTKSRSEFHNNKSNSDGLFSWCKDCVRQKVKRDQAIYRANNEGKDPYANSTKKRCPQCKMLLSRKLFSPAQARLDGLSGYCRDCDAISSLKKNAKKQGHNILFPQNFTGKEVREMRIQQGNRCYFCGTHEDDHGRQLCLDHNHVTGKIRGLICGWCNRTLVPALEKLATLSTEEKHRYEDYIYNPPAKRLYETEYIEKKFFEQILQQPLSNQLSRTTYLPAVQ